MLGMQLRVVHNNEAEVSEGRLRGFRRRDVTGFVEGACRCYTCKSIREEGRAREVNNASARDWSARAANYQHQLSKVRVCV